MVERNCVTRGQGLCLVSEKCPAISSYTCDKKDQRERESPHLVHQLGLKLRRFLGELVQKVRACFW